MKKEISVRDVDCPNCAAKIEKRIQKLEHLDSACFNFIGELLTIEYEDLYEEKILKEVSKIIYDIEPDAEIEMA